MIRILVVDDHPVVREGLAAVLEDQDDFTVVGSAASGEEAIERASALCPDIVLLDLEMPASGGIDAIPALIKSSPSCRVIIFTAYDTDERVFGALQSGAKGYLLKGAPAADIARAVRAVFNGGSHLEPRVAARVVARMGAGGTASLLLTPRETQVLRCVAEGLPNKQIARAMKITESTVKFHLTSIFGKLGADNRAQAVAVAAQRGML